MPAPWHRALTQEPARPTRPVWKATTFDWSDGARITKGGSTILVTGQRGGIDAGGSDRDANLILAQRIAAELNGDAARTCPTCNTTWYPGDFR